MILKVLESETTDSSKEAVMFSVLFFGRSIGILNFNVSWPSAPKESIVAVSFGLKRSGVFSSTFSTGAPGLLATLATTGADVTTDGMSL